MVDKVKLVIYHIADFYFEVDSAFQLESCWQKFEESGNLINTDIVFCPLSSRVINWDLEYAKCKDTENIFISYGSFVITDELFHYVYSSTWDKYINSIFLAYLFSTHALKRQMLKFHCSVIEHHGKGLLFLGPSGIGKTTQAELWCQYQEATIINGDVGFVQNKEKEVLVWGTPWHGSSSYCENMSVPVVAFIVLKQGMKNKIRKLNGFEMVSEVGKNVLYPTWVENGTEAAMDILDQLLQRIPVYELTNKADEDSVLMVKQVVFDEKN